MDNHFVPNLTIGPVACSALRNYGACDWGGQKGVDVPGYGFLIYTLNTPLMLTGVIHDIDVHLMVSPVDNIVGAFADAGASYITFHPEASLHIDRSLQLIRSLGCKPGLAFSPSTTLDCLKYVMDKVSRCCSMTLTTTCAASS